MSKIKYDDTDYLINREESIEYKISDTNVSSIEEDIMSEEAFNELIDNFEIVGTLTEYGRRAIKQNVKKLQKRIKELEEENKIYALNGDNVRLEIYIKNNYIPVQKVKDKIEEKYKQREKAEKDNKIGTGIVLTGEIKALEELVEDK